MTVQSAALYSSRNGPGRVTAATLSRLRAHMAADVAGIASAASTPYALSAVDELVGTDIEIDALDNTVINILTSGIYVVTWLGSCAPDTPGDGVSASLGIGGPFVGPYIDTGTATGLTALVAGGPGYLPAGTTITFVGAMATGGGTWTLFGIGNLTSVAVQRIV